MNKKPENPAAFPNENDANKQYNYIREGMTLRDYFAAAALQGIIANSKNGAGDFDYKLSQVADDCYAFADAMLRMREPIND